MQALWKQTKEVTLRGGLVVTVRHIGTPDDPFLWETIWADFSTAYERARVVARKKMAADHGSIGAALEAEREALRDAGVDAEVVERFDVKALVLKHGSDRAAYSKLVKDCVVNGVDYDGKTGREAYDALFHAGGPEALSEAASAAREFNQVGHALGEG